MIDTKQFYKDLAMRMAFYGASIRQSYYGVAEELIRLAMKISHEYDPSKPFKFDGYTKGMSAKAETIVKGLTTNLERTIVNASGIEKKMADINAGKIASAVLGGKTAQEKYKMLFPEKPALSVKSLLAPLGTSATVMTAGGLKLSDRVWNLAGSAKSEIEMIINKGLSEGMSADKMSGLVRQYLNEPDKLFRRVRNAKGELVYSDEAKKYHPGRGVYRSSYKNAMRLARTEINRAYHAQEHKRWQTLDFIVGFRVELSGSHPVEDICDELAGDYPKTFMFTGWHPQCMCHTIALIEGEHAAVTKMPENFTRWQGDNADRIEAAKDRGTLPSFLKDNPKTIKPVKTDAQKADIQARWDARKKANARTLKTAKNVFNAVKNFKDINFAKLQQYIKDGNLMAMKTETKAVAQAMVELQKKQRAISDIIPDVKNYNKQFTLQELEAVKVAVNKNIIFYEKLSLEEQKQKLEFEIDWLYQHKKYSTWEVSKAAYQRQLGKVEYKILNNEVDLLINTAKLLNAKSKSKLAGLLNNKEVSREYIEKVTAAVDALLKQRSKAIKGGLPNLTTREIAQLLDKYEKETIESADGRLRPWAKYVWNTLSLEEKNLLTKYTQTYNYLNEPLRGLPYYGSTIPNAAHVRDLPILTKALSKFKMPEHTIVRRGTDSWVIKELGYGLDKLKVGDVFTDKGFLSTAAHRTKGFSKKYHFIIVVPKGSQGFYAEPFSHYTDENKFTYADSPKHANLWNGQSKETIKSEMEWIGQRGSTFKVLKRQGNDIYLQLIGQLQ